LLAFPARPPNLTLLGFRVPFFYWGGLSLAPDPAISFASSPACSSPVALRPVKSLRFSGWLRGRARALPAGLGRQMLLLRRRPPSPLRAEHRSSLLRVGKLLRGVAASSLGERLARLGCCFAEWPLAEWPLARLGRSLAWGGASRSGKAAGG